ncbi:MAG TPA: MgtC/SapB family protein [Candidatus Limnocylindrales bacterium]|nr:MgtC/SapB family protein [Candidatus Limnocylindrales bacterium]
MLQILWEELTGGFPDVDQLQRVAFRMLAATVMGGIVGIQRERAGKPAGLRTHMLVAIGSAMFVLSASAAGMELDEVSRVIQGIAAGIGFLGAGAILKLEDRRTIQGLTTAASIWVTAAAGVAAGLGRVGTALFGVILTWIVLSLIALMPADADDD